MVALLDGSIEIAGESVSEGRVALLAERGSRVELASAGGAKLLFLGGEPIREPIVGYGPFVMNTEQEIRQAIADYQAGRMGHLAARA